MGGKFSLFSVYHRHLDFILRSRDYRRDLRRRFIGRGDASSSSLCLLYPFLQVAETTKHIAGGMYLISGFILCMALRELDAVTDLIPYLSWVHLVAIAVSGSAWLAYKNKDTVIRGLAVFARSRASVFMMTGLVCVLIFSRLFGSKHIWYTLYDVERVRILKNVVEEGLEFFGDALIFASSMMIFRKYRSPTQTASDTEDHSYKDDVGQ